jgi:hypothetical protein
MGGLRERKLVEAKLKFNSHVVKHRSISTTWQNFHTASFCHCTPPHFQSPCQRPKMSSLILHILCCCGAHDDEDSDSEYVIQKHLLVIIADMVSQVHHSSTRSWTGMFTV